MDPLSLALIGLVAAAVVADLRRREIPDGISLAVLAAASLAAWLDPERLPVGARLWGLGIAFAIGLAAFRFAGFGGGDVKLVAALGAALGVEDVLRLLLYTALAGGALAAAGALRRQREVAYAPAIGVGLLAVVARSALA